MGFTRYTTRTLRNLSIRYELIATPNDDALFSHSHEHHLAPNAGGRPGM